MKVVVPLNELPDIPISELGRKAFSLSLLIKNGYPVPKGFVICSSIFRDFLSKNEIKDKITSIIDIIDSADHKSLEVGSKKIAEFVQYYFL